MACIRITLHVKTPILQILLQQPHDFLTVLRRPRNTQTVPSWWKGKPNIHHQSPPLPLSQHLNQDGLISVCEFETGLTWFGTAPGGKHVPDLFPCFWYLSSAWDGKGPSSVESRRLGCPRPGSRWRVRWWWTRQEAFSWFWSRTCAPWFADHWWCRSRRTPWACCCRRQGGQSWTCLSSPWPPQLEWDLCRMSHGSGSQPVCPLHSPWTGGTIQVIQDKY